jgi:hypothetical protein
VSGQPACRVVEQIVAAVAARNQLVLISDVDDRFERAAICLDTELQLRRVFIAIVRGMSRLCLNSPVRLLGDSELAFEIDRLALHQRLCVPKIRFCNIGGAGRRESGVP